MARLLVNNPNPVPLLDLDSIETENYMTPEGKEILCLKQGLQYRDGYVYPLPKEDEIIEALFRGCKKWRRGYLHHGTWATMEFRGINMLYGFRECCPGTLFRYIGNETDNYVIDSYGIGNKTLIGMKKLTQSQ